MGKLERIKEAIDICGEYGMELKLQLFPNEEKYTAVGNIYLSHEVFKLAFEYARSREVVLSASVFDMVSYYALRSMRPSFIKFAFSKKDQTQYIQDCLDHGIECIVSCDVMSDHAVPDKAIKLYCIPEYPVRYEIDFDMLFSSGRFQGFSDHTLGLRQTKRAIEAGAKIIEKHVRLGYEDEVCPDASFAVNLRELGEFKRRIES